MSLELKQSADNGATWFYQNDNPLPDPNSWPPTPLPLIGQPQLAQLEPGRLKDFLTRKYTAVGSKVAENVFAEAIAAEGLWAHVNQLNTQTEVAFRLDEEGYPYAVWHNWGEVSEPNTVRIQIGYSVDE